MVNFKEMSVEELKKLIKGAREELTRRMANNLVIYTHDCKSDSRYHLSRYKHWAKKVDDVDITKTNGYAFQGKFLDVESEHKLPVGTIVVEACGDNIRAYKLTENGKDRIAEANRKAMSNLIAKVAEQL